MQHDDRAQAAPFIGIGGLVVAAFLYAWSAIALSGWLHSLVMPVLWLVLFAVGCASFARRPRLVPVLAVVAVVAWFVLLLA